MPTIKTKVDDATYQELVRQRKAGGLPSVSALFLSKCGVLNDQKEAMEIVRRALAAAKKKSSGSQFQLRELFGQPQWTKFSKGARLRAGKMFYTEIGSAVHGIRPGGKSPSNHQIYISA
jgi:hypothetical protein